MCDYNHLRDTHPTERISFMWA